MTAAEGGAPEARRRGAARNEDARRKQYMFLSLIAGVVAVLVVGFSYLSRTGAVADFGERPRLTVPGQGVDSGELWRKSAEEDIRVLEESERRLRDSLSRMEDRLETVVVEIEQARIAEQEAAFEREVLLLASMETPAPDEVLKPQVLPASPPFPEPLPPEPVISLVKVGASLPPVPLPDAAAAEDPPPARERGRGGKPEREKPDEDYIPSGSFMRAVILGGIDAPTGNVSRDNPHPVLLRISDEARLPNLERKDLRECFVLAAGYGDISSERALLRTERMSCRRDEGGYFDSQVRGFVVGEDGRAGVRGKLVTKQGQLLQRSLLAGIGSGLSDVFRTSYTERLRASTAANSSAVASSSSATVTVAQPTYDFGDYAAAGLASGTGTALGRLSDYYIALAERTHPIIEVGAGRTVDIVLQEGIDLSEERSEDG